MALVVCAALALVYFTAVYRNSSAFSTANGMRCRAISGEHRSAEQQFAGTIVPLPADLALRVSSVLEFVISADPVQRSLPVQQVALCRCLRHRPPPAAVV
jgi:hypothetical protein